MAFERYGDDGTSLAHPHQIEVLTRLAAGIVALVYMIGMAVVVLHLSHYGVAYFAILRAQYVIAGFWCIIPILVCLFYAIVVIAPIERRLNNEEGAPSKLLVIFIAILAAIPIGIIVALLPRYFPKFEVYPFTKLIFIAAVWVVSSMLIYFTWWPSPRHGAPRPHRMLSQFLSIMLVGFILCLHVLSFSKDFYPHIPASIGGGKPIPVRVILRDNVQNLSGLFPCRFLKGREADVDLLLESDDKYVFLCGDGDDQVISINRECVMAVLSKRQNSADGSASSSDSRSGIR